MRAGNVSLDSNSGFGVACGGGAAEGRSVTLQMCAATPRCADRRFQWSDVHVLHRRGPTCSAAGARPAAVVTDACFATLRLVVAAMIDICCVSVTLSLRFAAARKRCHSVHASLRSCCAACSWVVMGSPPYGLARS